MNSLVSPLPASTAVPLCLSDGRLNPEAVGWSPQERGDRGMSWDLALGRHLGQIGSDTDNHAAL